MFTFTDTTFGGGALSGRIGYNYTGSKDINLSGYLDVDDYFGTSVSLDGTRLAVGAERDDGVGDALSDSGAVYLFTFTDTTLYD